MSDIRLPDKCMHYVREPDGSYSVYDQFKGDLMRVFHLADPNCFKRVLLGCPGKNIDPILKIRIFLKQND